MKLMIKDCLLFATEIQTCLVIIIKMIHENMFNLTFVTEQNHGSLLSFNAVLGTSTSVCGTTLHIHCIVLRVVSRSDTVLCVGFSKEKI